MPTPREALLATLGEAGVATLDEAGVGEYIEELLADASSGEADEDVAGAVGPLLVDVGVAADEAAAEPLCAALLFSHTGLPTGQSPPQIRHRGEYGHVCS